MPRGRPKKNPVPESVETKETKTEIKTETKTTQTSTKEDKYPKCERCHTPIPTTPIALDVARLTGLAPWHREIKNDRVCICTSCAKKLNKLVDEFLQNNGKGVEKKFNI